MGGGSARFFWGSGNWGCGNVNLDLIDVFAGVVESFDCDNRDADYVGCLSLFFAFDYFLDYRYGFPDL